MFSYFIMKNIINNKNNIKILFLKTKNQTYDTSFSEYGDLRVQEPTSDGNLKMNL